MPSTPKIVNPSILYHGESRNYLNYLQWFSSAMYHENMY